MPPDQPETAIFVDDGKLPNSNLPVIIYRGAIEPERADPARSFETVFSRNGWTNGWRDGLYSYHHYHSTSHEVLGVAKGRVTARLGGRDGDDFDLTAGDVLVVPAGVGHQRVQASADFLLVGAYPDGRDWDLIRPYDEGAAEHDAAVRRIAALPTPALDPVQGPDGPLLRLWRV